MTGPIRTGLRMVSLGTHIDHGGAHRRSAVRARLRTLLATLTGQPCPDIATASLLRRLQSVLDGAGPDQMWLALAVLDARLPDHAAVLSAVRTAHLDGPLAALADTLRSRRWSRRPADRWPTVEVRAGAVLVDVHHTSETTFATGIQRVARQSALRWARDHDPVLIGWTRDYTALRRLNDAEVRRALYGIDDGRNTGARYDVLVPWRATYVLPELLAEPPRAHALRALVEFSGCATAVIGFDCVPLTSAETTAYGMSGGFALNLTAVARMDRVATISHSAATEYRGWRTMLSGVGLRGPNITPISLPIEASTPSSEALAEARDLLMAGEQPMILVVGSHEPRKNHLAVLHAAELLWRDGLKFSLNFVGGNSWNSERFFQRLTELQELRRPVQSVSALSDSLLWAAYQLARCTVFPSLSEGFGLPVAESLASGTPVITANFGSMREIAAAGGALLVDPRDNHDLAEAMRRLLTDDALHRQLSTQARALPLRSWDEYAEEAWNYLVNDVLPADPDAARRERAGQP